MPRKRKTDRPYVMRCERRWKTLLASRMKRIEWCACCGTIKTTTLTEAGPWKVTYRRPKPAKSPRRGTRSQSTVTRTRKKMMNSCAPDSTGVPTADVASN